MNYKSCIPSSSVTNMRKMLESYDNRARREQRQGDLCCRYGERSRGPTLRSTPCFSCATLRPGSSTLNRGRVRLQGKQGSRHTSSWHAPQYHQERRIVMEPTTTCCPNMACPARGHTGRGNTRWQFWKPPGDSRASRHLGGHLSLRFGALLHHTMPPHATRTHDIVAHDPALHSPELLLLFRGQQLADVLHRGDMRQTQVRFFRRKRL